MGASMAHRQEHGEGYHGLMSRLGGPYLENMSASTVSEVIHGP